MQRALADVYAELDGTPARHADGGSAPVGDGETGGREPTAKRAKRAATASKAGTAARAAGVDLDVADGGDEAKS
jgi:hypothetical protein